MRPLFLFLFIALSSLNLIANDGVFYGSGNHLIPIIETKITIQKEILTIKKEGDYFLVNVYYEMFNPDVAKNLEVGFEAPNPSGDVSSAIPKNGRHPFITDFTAEVNGTILNFDVAIVEDSVYFVNGIYKQVSPDKIREDDESYFDYTYVYHFKATFNKGLNKIIHTYKIKASNSVEDEFSFSYILSAAMRWGNKQIDDFTLMIDVGEFKSIYIDQTFFHSESEWNLIGKGKSQNLKTFTYRENVSAFHIQNGSIVFQKKNFKTKGELYFNEVWPYVYNQAFSQDTFNFKTHKLVFQLTNPFNFAADEQSLKILRNLPYARRGYVFKSKDIQEYFEAMPWYRKDPNYEANLSELTEEEKKWLKILKS